MCHLVSSALASSLICLKLNLLTMEPHDSALWNESHYLPESTIHMRICANHCNGSAMISISSKPPFICHYFFFTFQPGQQCLSLYCLLGFARTKDNLDWIPAQIASQSAQASTKSFCFSVQGTLTNLLTSDLRKTHLVSDNRHKWDTKRFLGRLNSVWDNIQKHLTLRV